MAPNLAVGKTKKELAFVDSNLLPTGCPRQPSLGLTTADSAPHSSPAASHTLYFTGQKKRKELHLFSVPSISSIRLSILS